MKDGWIWVDFENTPHVLFLEPFIHRLASDGWDVRISAKPQSQTLELARARGLPVTAIGRGDFSGHASKLLGGGLRSVALAGWALGQGRPRLLLSSSRSASLASWALRIPGVALVDYEHSALGPFGLGAAIVWLPDLLRNIQLPPAIRRKASFYAGLKENLYLDRAPALGAESVRMRWGAHRGDFLVVARPPATTAHYAADQSSVLWFSVITAIAAWEDSIVVISPRTVEQAYQLRHSLPNGDRIRILDRVEGNAELIAGADLLVGGGGTMNREAAVLGVPVWSTFCGPAPAIDEALATEGRLRWVRSAGDLEAALAAPRPGRLQPRGPMSGGFETIMTDIRERLRAR